MGPHRPTYISSTQRRPDRTSSGGPTSLSRAAVLQERKNMRPATATHGPRDGSSLSAWMRDPGGVIRTGWRPPQPPRRKAKAPLLHVSGTGGLRRIPWKYSSTPSRDRSSRASLGEPAATSRKVPGASHASAPRADRWVADHTRRRQARRRISGRPGQPPQFRLATRRAAERDQSSCCILAPLRGLRSGAHLRRGGTRRVFSNRRAIGLSLGHRR
ncbi:hypothetical protein ABIE49_002580 [Bradyrhizobium sp. OAE829]